MVTKLKVRETIRRGVTVWEVDAGRVEGKRRRWFFETEKLANKKLRELESERAQVGAAWTALETRDKADTLAVLSDIHAQGLTLRDVWEAFKKYTDTSDLEVVLLSDAH